MAGLAAMEWHHPFYSMALMTGWVKGPYSGGDCQLIEILVGDLGHLNSHMYRMQWDLAEATHGMLF